MNLGLVITEKHTKLRGFACPQAKKEKKEEKREREEEDIRMVWGMRGEKTFIYRVGGRDF